MKELKIADPESFELIDIVTTHGSLFFFVLIIGFYEMTTKLNWIKKIIRILLICIILGTQFSGLITIKGFYFGVYDTAGYLTVVAVFLILIRIVKFGYKKPST